jgi:general secretion pathway protein C
MNVRRALIAFFVAGATFLIAHTINAVIAEALLVPPGRQSPPPVVAQDSTAGGSPSALADQIIHSHLFALPPDFSIMTDGAAPVAVPRPPLNLASKMKLLGVVVSDRGGVSAIVELFSTKQQMFFRVHDHIPDAGELVDVLRNGIVVRQGDQQEVLELATGDAPPPHAPTAVPTAVPGMPLRKTVDKREVETALNDLPKLLSQARAVPVVTNGTMSGFRLDYIAPSSFYEKIGLLQGDVLKQVNGVEIKDPGTMLTLFQQLRNERNVKLDILRNSQRTTLAYEIR